MNGVNIQWILVNDGSTNNITSINIEKIQQALPQFSYYSYVKNKGKGFATRHGVREANAEFAIYTDIDFPYHHADLAAVYESLLQGNDLVLAKRGAQYYNQISKSRTWISKKFKGLVKLLFKIPTTDTQAGLKGLSSKAITLLLKTKINRYLFDLELVKLSAKEHLKIVEIPVGLKPGVVLANVSYKILFTELFNLFKILLR